MNTLKTTLLLGLLTGLLLLIGGAIGGRSGLMIAFIFAGLLNFSSYWYSDKIVLAMYRAQIVTEAQAPQLYQSVRELCTRSGLPLPRIYIIPSESLNAFATGRNPENAAVAITQGILRHLSPPELEGVLAHELAHVKNRDILISSVAATIAGAIMMLSFMARFAAIFGGVRGRGDDRGGGLGLLVMAILAPIAATLIQLAISRAREFQADARGAEMAGNSRGLAVALEKLSRAAGRVPLKSNPATAHMFIVNPLRGGGLVNLFSTHPPVEERIRRLRSLG